MKARYVVGGALIVVGAMGVISQIPRDTPNILIFGGCLLILFFGALCAASGEEGSKG